MYEPLQFAIEKTELYNMFMILLIPATEIKLILMTNLFSLENIL